MGRKRSYRRLKEVCIFFLNTGQRSLPGVSLSLSSSVRILRCSVKALDPKVLFYPSKELLDLPTAFVQSAYGQSRQCLVIAQKDQRLAGFRHFEPDTPQLFRIRLFAVMAVQGNQLIAYQPCIPIHQSRVYSACIQIALCSCHKEASCLVQCVKTLEVQRARSFL